MLTSPETGPRLWCRLPKTANSCVMQNSGVGQHLDLASARIGQVLLEYGAKFQWLPATQFYFPLCHPSHHVLAGSSCSCHTCSGTPFPMVTEPGKKDAVTHPLALKVSACDDISTHFSLTMENYVHTDTSDSSREGKSYHLHGRQGTGNIGRVAPTADLGETVHSMSKCLVDSRSQSHASSLRELSPSSGTLPSQLFCSSLWREIV